MNSAQKVKATHMVDSTWDKSETLEYARSLKPIVEEKLDYGDIRFEFDDHSVAIYISDSRKIQVFD
jgi:hypothetical protein